MQQAALEFVTVTHRYNPATDTSYLLTRQEVVSSSLEESKQSQQKLISNLSGTGSTYLCYIQEREVYMVPTGKKRDPFVARTMIKATRDIVEIQG